MLTTNVNTENEITAAENTSVSIQERESNVNRDTRLSKENPSYRKIDSSHGEGLKKRRSSRKQCTGSEMNSDNEYATENTSVSSKETESNVSADYALSKDDADPSARKVDRSRDQSLKRRSEKRSSESVLGEVSVNKVGVPPIDSDHNSSKKDSRSKKETCDQTLVFKKPSSGSIDAFFSKTKSQSIGGIADKLPPESSTDGTCQTTADIQVCDPSSHCI